MYNFLAILFHMGLVKKNTIKDYWSTNNVIKTVFAPLCMRRNRFTSVLSFFHLNDNDTFVPRGMPGHDPLHKIRPFHDHLQQIICQNFLPDQNVCIDEALCPWRGRSNLRVYMKDKPTKWGIKFYQLCDSKTGYVVALEIMAHEPGVSNTPFNVCHRLIRPYLHVGRCLYVDNYYCSPSLCDSIVSSNIMVVGTVCQNRKELPKDLMGKQLGVGEMDYRRRNQVLAIKWKDKRDVQVLTTKHLPTMAQHTSRTETKNKPTAVIDYSSNMGGVDLSDQLISYNPMHRKTVKWWKKLAFHLLTLCVVQAHILQSRVQGDKRLKKWGLKRFIEALCNALAREGKASVDSVVPAVDANDRLTGRHFPIPYDQEPEGGCRKRGTCIVCYAKAKKNDPTKCRSAQKTYFKCKQFDKSLCVHPCFELYHTKEDYST